jgi:hypothetical protein
VIISAQFRLLLKAPSPSPTAGHSVRPWHAMNSPPLHYFMIKVKCPHPYVWPYTLDKGGRRSGRKFTVVRRHLYKYYSRQLHRVRPCCTEIPHRAPPHGEDRETHSRPQGDPSLGHIFFLLTFPSFPYLEHTYEDQSEILLGSKRYRATGGRG